VFIETSSATKFSIKNYVKLTNLEVFALGFLGLLSITTGFYFRDIFTGFGSNYFNNSIYKLPAV
jgi:hypothetical protein